MNHEISNQLSQKLSKKMGFDENTTRTLQYNLDKILPSVLAKNPNALSHILHHQEPRHDEISEKGLIGRILLYPTIALPTCNGLTPDYFYISEYKEIFHLCKKLSEQSKAIDVDVVAAHLGAEKVDEFGGMQWLENLTMGAKDTETIAELRDRVVLAYRNRTLWKAANEAIDGTYKKGIEETEAIISKLLKSIQPNNNITNSVLNGEALSNLLLQQLEVNIARMESGIEFPGAPSAIHELTKLLGGWESGKKYHIAARPGMGKTAAIVAELDEAMKAGEVLLFFSMEMPALEIAQRIFTRRCKITKDEFNKGLRTPQLKDTFYQFLTELEQSNLYIDDTPGVTWQYIRNKALEVKNKHGVIDRVMLDYLQLMNCESGAGNREQQISEITRNLKSIAKELHCAVIEVGQLSRAVETRGGMKKPILSDLRESGGIEQDADVVIFLYRPEYYQILEDEEGNSLRGIIEFIVAKHRGGALDTIRAFFDAKYIRVCNIEEKPGEYFNDTHSFQDKLKQQEEWIELTGGKQETLEF